MVVGLLLLTCSQLRLETGTGTGERRRGGEEEDSQSQGGAGEMRGKEGMPRLGWNLASFCQPVLRWNAMKCDVPASESLRSPRGPAWFPSLWLFVGRWVRRIFGLDRKNEVHHDHHHTTTSFGPLLGQTRNKKQLAAAQFQDAGPESRCPDIHGWW
ncbi:hypothetical protein BKA65DRAFT_475731 [Rhexocercosporidium sp. MPI-PUGE-AT-0058]|nr:hypothetical protein BKA65DRAFT_475731 [Rhexocercosporidium sp. MPI-PUGE-AT-0058]